MSEAIAINYPAFNTKVKVNKRKVIKELEKKVEDGKLEMLKASLKEKNLPFNDEIKDYYNFIADVQKNLKDRDLAEANTIINNLNREVDRMVLSLKEGSTTAFTKFLQTVNEKVLSPVGNAITNSLAMNTVMSLIPSIPVKIGASIALTGIALHNINKVDKYKIETNRTYELNKILQEHEVTFDNEGDILDTRFNENDQNIIRGFLKSNNSIYEDTGYLSLREAIYSLDNEKKEELLNKLDITKEQEDRLAKLNDNIFTRFAKKVIAPVGAAAAAGTGIATSVNAVDPTILSGALNTGIVGTIVSKLANSKVIGWITGAVTGVVNVVGKHIPVIGSIISKASAIENIAVLTVAGAGVGLIGVIGKGIYNALKNKKRRYETQELQQQILKKDDELYGKTDIEEIQKMRTILKERSQKAEDFIINIVCKYMDELGVEYNVVPKTIDELQKIINELPKKEKRKVKDLFDELYEYLNRDPNTFRRCLKKAGKFIRTVFTLGLAGMNVANILTSGGFFAMVKTKLFGESPTKNTILTFDDTKGREAYNEANKIVQEKVEVNAKPEPQPLPPPPQNTPAPTPSPTPTPTPTPAPTAEEVVEEIAINAPKATKAVKAASNIHNIPINTDEMPRGYILGKMKYSNGTLPKLNCNLQDVVMLNKPDFDFSKFFSELQDEDLLSLIVNSPEEKFTRLVIEEKIDRDVLLRIKDLVENSPMINRDEISYRWVETAMNNRINMENGIVERALKVNDALNKVNTGLAGVAAFEEERGEAYQK